MFDVLCLCTKARHRSFKLCTACLISSRRVHGLGWFKECFNRPPPNVSGVRGQRAGVIGNTRQVHWKIRMPRMCGCDEEMVYIECTNKSLDIPYACLHLCVLLFFPSPDGLMNTVISGYARVVPSLYIAVCNSALNDAVQWILFAQRA